MYSDGVARAIENVEGEIVSPRPLTPAQWLAQLTTVQDNLLKQEQDTSKLVALARRKANERLLSIARAACEIAKASSTGTINIVLPDARIVTTLKW